MAKDSQKKKKKYSDDSYEASDGVKLAIRKKKDMKESKYRKRFDNLIKEIDDNLVNTEVRYGQKLYESNTFTSFVMYTRTETGAYDLNVYPQKMLNRDQNDSGVPVSQEPIAFSKIITATSILFGKVPDATVIADDKVYARAQYELWKKTWENRFGNGKNTLMMAGQNVLTYGWGAWRVYPRRVQVPKGKVYKLLFDGIYREPLDPKRTWLGTSFNVGDLFTKFEVYYEKDVDKEKFFEIYPEAKDFKGKLNYCVSSSEEAREENQEKAMKDVTIGYYEDPMNNKFIIHCGEFEIYCGEMPNDDCFGSVVVAQCFVKNANDPYGVGIYELVRGNTALYTYLTSLNAQQIEAEIYPLLFGTQTQNGTATYKRGPNVVNPKSPGSEIDVVRTTGNVSGGIGYADKQKVIIEENTGINNIVAGTGVESTLGGTVIQKEAAFQRLTPPRNSVCEALELDALITVSWIKQTFPADRMFQFDTDEDIALFTKMNPDYFVETRPVIDEQEQITGIMLAASPRLKLNFDFDEDGNVIEANEPRAVSSRGLFTQMDRYGHTSGSIDFIIDPTSMLLPSQEIEKQNYIAIYPVISNSITQIFASRMQDPALAKSLTKTLEQFLETQRQSIFDYIPKQQYDEIMEMKPAMNPMQQMQQMMQGGGAPGQEMMKDGQDPTQPQSPQEVPRPQTPLGAAFDASVGRAKESSGFADYLPG